jgi:hypothetical protein
MSAQSYAGLDAEWAALPSQSESLIAEEPQVYSD